MKKILFVLFASLLVLSACGNQGEKESKEKPSNSTVEKKKEKKEEKSIEEKESKTSNEVSTEETESANIPSDNSKFGQKTTNAQNQANIDYNDPNTVIETYNGQTHVTTNNTLTNIIYQEKQTLFPKENTNIFTRQKKLKERKKIAMLH